MHAIIQTGGKQYRVAVGDTLRVELISSPDQGKGKVEFPVLLVENGDNTEIGRPVIPGASVTGEVVGEGKEDKILFYRYKRRKGSERSFGHRQRFTAVKITEIKVSAEARGSDSLRPSAQGVGGTGG